MNVTLVRLLFLRIIALLTLTLTSANISPDTDPERNPIPDPVFNVYPDLNCTRRTRRTRRILPTPVSCGFQSYPWRIVRKKAHFLVQTPRI